MMDDLFEQRIDVPAMVAKLPLPLDAYRNAASCVGGRNGGFCVYGQPVDTMTFHVVARFWDGAMANDAAEQLTAVIRATRALVA